MTTKLDRIATIEAELAKLKAEVQAEVQAEEKQSGGNPHVMLAPQEGIYWYVSQTSGGKWRALEGSFVKCAVVYRTKEAAKAHAEARNVMDELRVQPGACAWKTGPVYLEVWDCGEKVRAVSTNYPAYTHIGGCFKSFESARAAIRTVGEDRIRKAAFTLAGVVEGAHE